MIVTRKSEERGHANHGWLNSYHTFSFAGYYDPKHMGFRSLRVINEDRVGPGQGFGTHGHNDMEIVSYVLSGKLAHRDSMGHEEFLGPNEIQRMSAGTGIKHSEYNGSAQEPVHFFQIWIEPAASGTKPSYEQIKFDPATKQGRLKLLAGPNGGSEAATIQQDASIYVSELAAGQSLSYDLGKKRGAWLHVVKGNITVNGESLQTGDAAAITDESKIEVLGKDTTSEILLFDVK